jgi:hypothetical protein
MGRRCHRVCREIDLAVERRRCIQLALLYRLEFERLPRHTTFPSNAKDAELLAARLMTGVIQESHPIL